MNRLSKDTERRIASGQNITTIPNCIKELIENSLDAGATSLDIKLEKNGLASITVKDNGSGIPASFENMLGERHCTSKISEFDDLDKLETFGFRGEALNSICAISEEVTVATRTGDEGEVGRVYEFDRRGSITRTQRQAMGQGTSVTVRRIFHNLPVRRENATTNQQKTASQVTALVRIYAILHPSLRITLKFTDITSSSSRISKGCNELVKPIAKTHLEAISQLFGRNLASNLSEYGNTSMVTAKRTSEGVDDLYDSEEDDSEEVVDVENIKWVEIKAVLPKLGSDPSVVGRANPDRYYLNVNGRPVSSSDKTLQEIVIRARDAYFAAIGSANGKRYPFLFVNIRVPPEFVDVNLEPDKSRVVLQNSTDIIACFGKILLDAYNQEKSAQSMDKALSSPRKRKAPRKDDTSRQPRVMLGCINGQLIPMTAMIDQTPSLMKMGREKTESRIMTEVEDCDDEEEDSYDEEDGQLIQPKSKRRRVALESDTLDLESHLKDKVVTLDSVVYSSKTSLDSWLDKKRGTSHSRITDASENRTPDDESILFDIGADDGGLSGNYDCNGVINTDDRRNSTLFNTPSKQKSISSISTSPLLVDMLIQQKSNINQVNEPVSPTRITSESVVSIPSKLVPPPQNTPKKKAPTTPSTNTRQLTLAEMFTPRSKKSVSNEKPSTTSRNTNTNNKSSRPHITDTPTPLLQSHSALSLSSPKALNLHSVRDADMIINVDLSNVAENYGFMVEERLAASRQESHGSQDVGKIQVVGPIASNGDLESFDDEESSVWSLRIDGKLVVINLCRLIEVLLYRELMFKAELPLKKQRYATILRSEALGGSEGIQFLRRLTEHESSMPVSVPGMEKKRVSDARLVANGFELFISTDVKNPKGEATVELESRTDVIPSYGLANLKDLMISLFSRPIPEHIELASTRPVRVNEYFVAQATSMACEKVKEVMGNVTVLSWSNSADKERKELVKQRVLAYVNDFFTAQEDMSQVPAGSQWTCPHQKCVAILVE
ncbi:hypothetical protein SeLEV6574_g02256 [Synchytrium endobioticum]|nr:hypothetical protein SeLEV6574_g02256 [Synchytrium endobioticum]